VTGIVDVVVDGETRSFFPVGDVPALSERCRLINHRPKLCPLDWDRRPGTSQYSTSNRVGLGSAPPRVISAFFCE